MAKVRIRNMDKVLKRIGKILGEDLTDTVVPKAADMALTRIKAETRKGNSLVTEAKMKPLQKHSKYIRRALSKKPVSEGGFQAGSFFRWNKSNLSQTGQLLESLEIDLDKNKITIAPTGDRDPSLGGGDEFKTNRELARDLAARGFRFLGLDKRGVKRIRQLIIDEIRRLRLRAGFK